jgi:hypothetical protein
VAERVGSVRDESGLDAGRGSRARDAGGGRLEHPGPLAIRVRHRAGSLTGSPRRP